MLGSWRDITRFSPGSLVGMVVLQLCSFACLWALQYVALQARRWWPVITSQLAGNALAKVAPGGGAMGSALQYRMLVQAGLPPASTVSALTAVNLLVFGVVLALPVLAIPALLRGAVDRTLLETAVDRAGRSSSWPARVGAVLLSTDGPLAWVGRVIQRVRNRLRRGAEPLHRLPERLLRERDRILATLGPRWKRALVATVGRWTFDYLTLLAALAAIGSHPRPALVLLAFCGAQVLAQIPVTPGGLGFVEAGLTAMLALAGVKRRRRGPGHVRLPAVLLLDAAPARIGGVRPAQAPERVSGGGLTAGAGRARGRRPRAGARRRACGRCCAGGS